MALYHMGLYSIPSNSIRTPTGLGTGIMAGSGSVVGSSIVYMSAVGSGIGSMLGVGDSWLGSGSGAGRRSKNVLVWSSRLLLL